MARYLLKDGRECIIREATVEDAGEIIAYVNQVAGESDNLTFGVGEFTTTVEEEVEILRKAAQHDKSLFLIAKVAGQIVSFLTLSGKPRKRLQHVGEFGITVLKEYWGQGIGKLMLQIMIDFAKAHGLTKINLKVRTDNVGAIALYHQLGFEVEGIERRSMLVDGVYVDCMYMGLILE